MTSKLSELSLNEEKEHIHKSASFSDIIQGDYSTEERVKAVEGYYTEEKDKCCELIYMICSKYMYANIKSIEKLLLGICESKLIDIDMKMLISRNIQDYGDEEAYTEALLKIIIDEKFNTLNISIQIQSYCWLINRGEKVNESILFICEIVNSSQYPNDTRFRILKGLKIDEEYHSRIYWMYFNNYNDTHYNILASQYLLRSESVKSKHKEEVMDWLLSISENKDTSYETKAEASDILTLLATDEKKAKAQEILRKMGKEGKLDSIYNNKENVHNSGLINSVKNMIKKIKTINSEYDYKDIIEDLCKHPEYNDSVKDSLTRIKEDNIYYMTFTLEELLCKVYAVIKNMTDECEKNTYTERLMEELRDMDKTCTSGHISRLLNTLSGYKDYKLSIDYKDQIISNIQGRLRKMVMDIKEEKLRDVIYDQMVIQGYSVDNKEFNQFFIKNIMKIQKEMETEFVETKILERDDFDIFFRLGIMKFRGHSTDEIASNDDGDNQYEGGESETIETPEGEIFKIIAKWGAGVGVKDI